MNNEIMPSAANDVVSADENNSEIAEEVIEYPTLSFDDIVDLTEHAGKTLIFTHVNPDGDCMGAAFAYREIIRACGGDARVVNPCEIPKRLRFLGDGESDLTITEEELDNYDTICSVDVASDNQLGDYAAFVGRFDYMIDHHGMGTPFAPNYVNPESAAAGEIILEIYRALQEKGIVGVLPDCARKLYAAIVSDTGSFKYSNTTPHTHILAAGLVAEINGADDGGDDTAGVCHSLFGQRTLKELTSQMLAIQNLRFRLDGKLAAVLFTQQLLADNGLTDSDIGNVVDTPRGVEGVLVAFSVTQQSADNSKYKVSSRANADIDCAAVCASFGGGGHTRAAGCTITADSPEEAFETALNAFAEKITESEKAKTEEQTENVNE